MILSLLYVISYNHMFFFPFGSMGVSENVFFSCLWYQWNDVTWQLDGVLQAHRI